MDTPGMMQGQFLIQAVWVSLCSSSVLWLLCQWFSVRLSPCRLYYTFFSLLFFRLTCYLYGL